MPASPDSAAGSGAEGAPLDTTGGEAPARPPGGGVAGEAGAGDGGRARGAPVVVGGDTLFHILGAQGPLGPGDRSAAVVDRLRRASRTLRVAEGATTEDTVRIVRRNGSPEITIGGVTVLTVTEADAEAAGTTEDALADSLAAILRNAVRTTTASETVRILAFGLLWTAAATGALGLVLWLMSGFFPKVYRLLRMWSGSKIPAVRIQRLELVSAARLAQAAVLGAKGVRVGLTLVLLYVYISLVLSFFPWTAPLSGRFVRYVAEPLAVVGTAMVEYLPNLFFVAIIGFLTFYALKAIRLIFSALERGALTVPGFYPDWAMPTFKIVRVLVLAFAVVMAWPYLPRSDSAAFRGVAAFLGLLLTFGSAGAISNVIGGVVMVYMRPFQVGDRVRIADTEGDVVEKTLLVTRVRTPKNVVITIPNAQVLGSHIVNFSTTAAEDEPLVLNTSVSIGYDVDWRTVHRLLLSAAEGTEGVLADPGAFVLQTALQDFYVAYELNAYTTRPREMARIYSELHQNIQDAFARAGVEILSPHYRATRDGGAPAYPRGDGPHSVEEGRRDGTERTEREEEAGRTQGTESPAD